jgi:PilZ domain-containing protein
MNANNDRMSGFPFGTPGDGESPAERRSCQRTKVNWQVEFTGVSNTQGWVHEGSKLVDYSQFGACFLAMSDVQPGMQLTVHVSLPVRMTRPLVFRGVVVRVEEDADVMHLFKEVAVQWQPGVKKAVAGQS